MTPTVPDVLDLAADIIFADGWGQGRSVGPGGEKCLVGGIGAACHRLHAQRLYNPSIDAVTAALGFEPRQQEKAIYWNDSKKRTQDDVEDLLRNTAKDLRNTTKEHSQ